VIVRVFIIIHHMHWIN